MKKTDGPEEMNEIAGMGDLGDERTVIPMGELGAEAQPPEELQDSEHGLVLKHPIKIGGEVVRALEFDLDGLTAADLHYASKYLKNLGIPVSVPALDYEYQLTLFVRAVKKKMGNVEYSDLMRLSASDASRATGLVRDFLLDKDPGLRDLGSEESSRS
ncbi:hypothetical protein CAFE_17810 [Caprobacter fermentans]|uniref:Phage tail assembly protein n=1 Tax=Caproicibacter fermentans TaxID=2576756 RepID=A0A6N8HZE6_9FIRM|nr:hypothetical protein [Caproicibacter fermentans]MVB11079.1 hypothetical protein [Caproicibacter fermentans]